jgi:hypothetical protein
MPCTPELDAFCQDYARAEGAGRYVYARCAERDHVTFCAAGDLCDHGTCLCTPTRECAPNFEVCVSDTPDGTHYCARMCE